jgi:hypothetical protein
LSMRRTVSRLKPPRPGSSRAARSSSINVHRCRGAFSGELVRAHRARGHRRVRRDALVPVSSSHRAALKTVTPSRISPARSEKTRGAKAPLVCSRATQINRPSS